MALADGAGAGAGVLRKIGAGTLQLTATANTYSGTTQVQGGVLDITDDRQLGAAPGADAAQQLLLDGGTLRIGADTVLTATRHPRPVACGPRPSAAQRHAFGIRLVLQLCQHLFSRARTAVALRWAFAAPPTPGPRRVDGNLTVCDDGVQSREQTGLHRPRPWRLLNLKITWRLKQPAGTGTNIWMA